MGVYTIPMWLTLLLILPLLLILKKKISQNTQQLPPGPPKLPVLGNFLQLGALPHQSFWQFSKKYGPVMLVKLGRIPLVIISSAEAARVVLKVHDLNCCSRPQLTGAAKFTYNFLDLGFSPYSEYWREMRKISVLELFSLKRVQSFGFIREEEVALLMNSISESSSFATPVDISEKMFALTASITFRMAFGKGFRGSNFDDHEFQEVVHAVETFVGGFTAGECVPYVGWIFDRLSGYHAKLERVFRRMDTLFQEIIDDHLNPERTKPEQDDFIDMMLKVERDQSESTSEAWFTKNHIKAIDKRIRSRIAFFVESLTSEKKCLAESKNRLTRFIRQANDLRFAGTTKTTISLFPFFGATFFFLRDGVGVYNNLFFEDAREQLLGQLRIKCWNLMGKDKNMFLGGVDTSAITVIWAMAELSKKPELLNKAQSEIRKCIGKKGRVVEADIDQLQYLKMIIKETLRLHPPAPLLVTRETMSHFKVNGYDICPKTLIQVNTWAIGRDPNYWKNPEEFCPERFADNSIDLKGQHFELLPFGSGRRSCPAMNMGLITSEIALANLLYCFDWKLPNGMAKEDLNMEETAGQSLTVSKKVPLVLLPVSYLAIRK